MALKPSRRLPKAFQRKTSPLSRRVAQKRTRSNKGVAFRFVKLSRQWKRLVRSVQLSLTHIRIWCICAVVLTLVILVLFFLFSSTFAITAIQVSRQDRRVDIEEVQQLLSPNFGKHILFISPHIIERTILSAYPEIASAKVRRNFPSELQVLLYTDSIVAHVVVGDPDDTEADFPEESPIATEKKEGSALQRYLTSQGIYLEYPFALPAETSEDRLTLHVVDWAVKPTHRQQLLHPETLTEMQSVLRVLRETFGHTPLRVTLYQRAKEFHVQTERTILWFDLAAPMTAQINRYRKFLQALSLDAAEEYVDLRLHDRVVYR